MNQFITTQVKFFLMSVAWGAILLIMYDCLRIFRKVVKHGAVLMSIEDIIYWTISSVLIFRMMYRLNDGIIRGFSLLGILIGMVLYKYTISDYVVKGISFVLIKIKLLIKKVIHILLKPLMFLVKQAKRLFVAISKKVKQRIGRMNHFVQKRVRTLGKALQSKVKRGRMKKSDQNLMPEADSKKGRKSRKKHKENNVANHNKRVMAKQTKKSQRERRQEETPSTKEKSKKRIRNQSR